MNQEERALSGVLFAPGDSELRAIKARSHILSSRYSALDETHAEERAQILKELCGAFGEGSFIQGPLFMHYGRHTFIGKRCFINYDFTVQDDTTVTIGDDCNFGPRVMIVTPVHPLLPNERRTMLNEDGKPSHLCYAKPVTIGHDCWIGANVTICPGVTIGNNCVIGAGSVVTRDIPDNTLAVGVPCRPLRELSEKDSMAYMPDVLGGAAVAADKEG